jgi:hypothetical protein
LWAKLLVMLAVMVGSQALIERHMGWIDETCFVVRVGLHSLVPGSDPADPVIMASARELMVRDNERRYAARVAAAGDR